MKNVKNPCNPKCLYQNSLELTPIFESLITAFLEISDLTFGEVAGNSVIRRGFPQAILANTDMSVQGKFIGIHCHLSFRISPTNDDVSLRELVQ